MPNYYEATDFKTHILGHTHHAETMCEAQGSLTKIDALPSWDAVVRFLDTPTTGARAPYHRHPHHT